MSFNADVVFQNEKLTQLLTLTANKQLKEQFGDEIDRAFSVGIHEELKGEAVVDSSGVRCDSYARPEFWFEIDPFSTLTARGRLTHSAFPSEKLQFKSYMNLFGLCGFLRPMPSLEAKTYAQLPNVRGFSRISVTSDKSVVCERPSLPYIVMDKALFPEGCRPLYLFDENGEHKQFVFSNKPLRIEITL